MSAKEKILPRQRLVCSPEHFATIATSSLLAPALRLARSVNALRALITATVPSAVLSDGLRVRQSTNTLLYLGATLYEALEVLDHLGPALGVLESTREHLLPIKKWRELRKFKKTVLWPLRKSVVFHFDEDVLPRAFHELKFDPTVFRSEDSNHPRDLFYELADVALLPAAFKEGEHSTFLTNYRGFLNDTIVYTGYYCRAADEVLTEVATLLGFTEEVIE